MKIPLLMHTHTSGGPIEVRLEFWVRGVGKGRAYGPGFMTLEELRDLLQRPGPIKVYLQPDGNVTWEDAGHVS